MSAAGFVHVVLLRGVNVGGKNRLPMQELVAACVAIGGTDVTTYIQSGNVVLRARPALGARLARRLQAALLERCELNVPVVTRTAAELSALVRANPFLLEGAAPETLHVAFLAALPLPERAAKLAPERFPGDRMALVGCDLYLQFPHGLGQSKLTNAYLDRTLGTVSTVRNWRTVLALAELAERLDGKPQ